MVELAPLIKDLIIMLGVAAFVTILFQRIRQPVVLGYLVAGIIIGPYTPPYGLVTQSEDIRTLSELGVIFLMFSLGLEFSFHKLMRVGFSASVTGLFDVTMMFLIGYVVGTLMGWPYYDRLFLAAAMSISSTTIIIKAVDELKLKTKRFAELIFGILIVEDLLAILMLVALSTLVATQNFFSTEMFFSALQLVVVVGAWFIVGYFVVPSIFRQIANYVSQETLTIVSVALCLFLVGVAAYFHYSAALGAFIMGSILAETVLNHRIEILVRPIRDIFAAVFFISVGMLINPMLIIEQWWIVLLLSLVMIIGKSLVISTGSFLTGQSLSTSVRAGFGMGQIGEFSFIIAGLGVALNVTSQTLFPVIVAVSAITTFTTPYLIRFSGHISAKLERELPERVKYFLNGYSAWVYRVQSGSQKQPWFRKVSIRMFANAIVIALAFALTDKFIYPFLLDWVKNVELTNNVSLGIAILLSSPFIWGMLFSYRVISVPEFGKKVINPAIFIVWLLTFAEISFLSIVFFQSIITILILLALLSIFFIVAFHQLEKSYHWFERQLVSNIGQQKEANVKYEELAPWETHLVEVEVAEASPFAGKTLAESQVRELYDINVVAILHGGRMIVSPRGNERIVGYDKLIVLGNDKQIEAFRAKAESIEEIPLEINYLEAFNLVPVLISASHPLIGKTIRESRIRERINGMVVGFERDNIRILNPDPETVLREGDLLKVVGEAAKLKNL